MMQLFYEKLDFFPQFSNELERFIRIRRARSNDLRAEKEFVRNTALSVSHFKFIQAFFSSDFPVRSSFYRSIFRSSAVCNQALTGIKPRYRRRPERVFGALLG